MSHSPHAATVMVVDDTPQNLLLMTELLRPDYRLQVANSGERALALLAGEVLPDLILLDIMMPGRLDGLDMCRQIRADAGDAVKIAFVTAKGQSADFANGRSAKADAYIVKPFGPIKFLETVDWLLV